MRRRCAAGLPRLMTRREDAIAMDPAGLLARRRSALRARCAQERGRLKTATQVWCEVARPSALIRQAGHTMLEAARRRPIASMGLVALAVVLALGWRRAQGHRWLQALGTVATILRWGWIGARRSGSQARG